MRKLIHSIFLLAAAALLVVALPGCSKQARKARHLASADKYFAADQLDKAEVEYLNVLQFEGLNSRAIGQLGLIYFEQGRFGRSVPFLTKGRELQPENLDLRVKLGLIALATGDTRAARDEANFVLDRRPQDPDAPQILADSVQRKEDIEEIQQRLQNLPPATAGGAPVLVALGTLEFRQRHLQEAEAKFNQTLTLDPKSSAAYYALGNVYAAQNDRAKAEEQYKKAADLSPARSATRLRYAQYKIQTGDLPAGKKFLEEMTEKAPDFLPALNWLAEIALAEKKYDDCAVLLTKALARDPLHPEAMILNARLKMARGEYAKAVTDLQGMLNYYPKAPMVHYRLGVAYVATGDAAKAMDSLNQAVTLAPGFPDAAVLLAGLNVQKGDFSRAVVLLKPLLQEHARLTQAWLLLAEAYRGQNNLDDALAIYRQLEKSVPRNPQPPLLEGIVLLRQNKRAEAREAFERALAITPDLLNAVEQLVALDMLDKNFTAAQQRVQDQIARNPKMAGPHLLAARVAFVQKDIDQAEASLRKAIELEPDSPAAYMMLAGLYVQTKQQEKALTNFEAVAAKDPKNASALMLIGVIHDQNKDYPKARDAYEKALAVNPKFGAALNNLAYLYSERFNEQDKAFEAAQKARELNPHEPHTADTLGWILYKRRQFSWALSLLQESVDKLPDEPEIQLHLGLTQYMLGNEAGARVALQKSVASTKDFAGKDEAAKRLAVLAIDPAKAGPAGRALLEKTTAGQKDDPIAFARLGAIYERDGALDKAVDAYQASLQASPDNAGVMIQLAQILLARQETAKALDLAKNARKVAPEDPAVGHFLGRLAFQTADYSWANSLLQEAARKLPDDRAVLFDAARAAYAVGRVADAEAALRDALKPGAVFASADDARRMLEMIELSGDPVRAAAANAQVEQTLKANPFDVPALMVMGAINEQKADARAAIQTYEKALAQYPDFTPAKRRLAILYATTGGEDKKALELAMKARDAYPGDAELAKAMGVVLYRTGDYTRAVNLLQESARQRDRDAEVKYYLGMAQYRLKRTADSKRSLQSALDLGLTGDAAVEARKILAEK